MNLKGPSPILSKVRLEVPYAIRLREIYLLKETPKTLDQLAGLWRNMFLGAAGTPTGEQRPNSLIKGELVYGACLVETRHLVKLSNGASVHVACALDALIEGFFQNVEIESSCPHCQQPISLKMTDRQVVAASPTSTVLWMGVSPRGEGPTIETICPYINFFASNDHAAQWREKNTDQVGALLNLQEAREFLSEALPEPYVARKG